MGRAPCCDKANVKKGPWSPEEDSKLKDYIEKYGTGGNWIALPQKAGLKRCGKSCRLRWLNYLRPNIKHGEFSDHEDRIICSLFASIGSRWSIIAGQLPGRTDNDIKNYWNTKLKKKLMGMFASSQRKPAPLISSPLQTPSPTISPYKDSTSYNNYNYTPGYNKSFTHTLEPNIPNPPPSYLFNNNMYSASNSGASLLQTQESLVGPMQYCSVKDNNNLLMFGSSDQASCSSSEQSYGREIIIKQEECMNSLQGYISNGFEENQKFMLGAFENVNGWTEHTPLEYDVEEVKQINGCDSSFLFHDENKTQEKVMMYYY